MSSLNNIDDDSSIVNGAWSSLYNQEIILEEEEEEEEEEQQQPINNYNYNHEEEEEEEINITTSINEEEASAGQYLAAAVVPITGSMKIRKKRMMMRSSTSTGNNDQLNAELAAAAAAGGTSTSSSTFVKKKLDHNAKERMRRMKLNASYLALRALLQLPHSTRSKKRSWSAPSIVDKVLKYIPEMENEIQELESKKLNYINNVQLAAAKKNKKKKKKIINDNENENIGYIPTISVNEINKGEVIVQICMPRSGTLAFTNLLQRVEDDHQYIFCIKSLSTLYVCETRTCYHLHLQLQMNHISDGADYIAELRDKLLSWLG